MKFYQFTEAFKNQSYFIIKDSAPKQFTGGKFTIVGGPFKTYEDASQYGLKEFQAKYFGANQEYKIGILEDGNLYYTHYMDHKATGTKISTDPDLLKDAIKRAGGKWQK